MSAWINPDSSCPALRQDSTAALKQELAWAAHLGLQAVILPPPPETMRSHNYAQIILQVIWGGHAAWLQILHEVLKRLYLRMHTICGCLKRQAHATFLELSGRMFASLRHVSALLQALGGLSNMAVWIRIPLAPPSEASTSGSAAGSSPPDGHASATGNRCDDPWEWWAQLYALCESDPLLGVILEVPSGLTHEQVSMQRTTSLVLFPNTCWVTMLILPKVLVRATSGNVKKTIHARSQLAGAGVLLCMSLAMLRRM